MEMEQEIRILMFLLVDDEVYIDLDQDKDFTDEKAYGRRY